MAHSALFLPYNKLISFIDKTEGQYKPMFQTKLQVLHLHIIKHYYKHATFKRYEHHVADNTQICSMGTAPLFWYAQHQHHLVQSVTVYYNLYIITLYL